MRYPAIAVASKLHKYRNHGRNYRRGLALVSVVGQPLVNYQEVHVAECQQHEDDLREGLKQKFGVVFLFKVVDDTYGKAEKHVTDAENDGEFHFETVGELHAVLGDFPC